MSNLKKYLNNLLVFYTEYFEHPYHVYIEKALSHRTTIRQRFLLSILIYV